MLELRGDKLREKLDSEGENSGEKVAMVGDKNSGNANKLRRKFTVRDLAIQPTQRVMRYAMLYRGEYFHSYLQTHSTDASADLLAHTPHTSPSRALVESALEAAQRIAQKCDRAQNNAAFLPRLRRPSIVSSESKFPFRPFKSYPLSPASQEN